MQHIEPPVPAQKINLPGAAMEKRGSIALDQWRGLALVLVQVSHGFFHTNRVNGIGRVGVQLFFSISGMLVFRSLSRFRSESRFEYARSFWVRRLRRLYPAMLAYTIAMLPIVWLFQDHPELPLHSDLRSYLKSLPFVLTYFSNYIEAPPRTIGHLWSTSCEVQFYILAPLILIAAGSSEKRREFIYGFLLIVFTGLGLSYPLLARYISFGEYGKYHFEFAVWPMMAGFWCEYKRSWFLKFPAKWVTAALWSSTLTCAALLALILLTTEAKPLVIGAGSLLLGPCLLAYLFGCPIPGVLGNGMRWLGLRTYSIYLWQQPLTLCMFLPNFLHPVGALIAVALGGIWFHFFERPFLSVNSRNPKG